MTLRMKLTGRLENGTRNVRRKSGGRSGSWGSGDSPSPGPAPVGKCCVSRCYGLEDLRVTRPDSGHWVPFGAVQPMAEEKVHERRLRRAALRKGQHLTKSCKLDPDHPEFGRW